MPVTVIRSIRNSTEVRWSITNLENPAETEEGGRASYSLYPGDTWLCSIRIPSPEGEWQFNSGSPRNPNSRGAYILIMTPRPMELAVSRKFAVWQQGNHVRYSTDASWSENGPLVPGNNTAGGDKGVEIVGTNRFDAELRFY